MFRALVSRELLQHTLSHRYRTLLLTVVLFGALATVVRTHVYLRLLGEHQRTSAEYALVRAQVRLPFPALVMGYTQQKAPSALAVFCGGLEGEMTRSLNASRHFEDSIGPRKMPSLFLRINPTFDMATVVAILFSLAALVIMHDGLSGEREQGTLKVVLAGPVPKATVVLAKWTAGVIALCLPLGIAALLGLVYLLAVARPELSTGQWLALLSMLGASVVYCMVFLSVGLTCSALSSRSSTSLATCLFVWVCATVVAPSLVPSLTRHFARVPTHSDVRAAIEREYQGTASWLAAHPDAGGPGETVLYALPGVRRIYADFRKVQWQQHGVATSLVGLSPATAYTYLVSELAGTGVGSYQVMQDAWQQVGGDYREGQFRWVTSNNTDVLREFAPRSPSVRESLAWAFFPAVSLVASAVLLLLASVLAFALRARVHLQA